MRRPDPARVTTPAPAGLPRAEPSPHAVVVGGGIAGLTAATGLAERGVRVTLLEREHVLGGRVAGWTETVDETPLAVNRGFHAFFRQYYNLRALLRRADPGLQRLVPVPDYPLLDADGRQDSFRGLPRHPPWNALAFALRSPTFRLRDLAALRPRAAAPLAAVSVPDTYHRLDEVDVTTFLDAINFPAAARHLAMEVFSRSFFAPPEVMSAAELATMFHLYFLGSSEGLLFDVPSANYDAALWDPLRTHLVAQGVDIRLQRTVQALERSGPTRWRVLSDGGAALDVDAVVLATDVTALQEIARDSPALDVPDWRDRVAALRSAPPFLVHRMWLDAPLRPERPAFVATGGMPPLDNLSRPDRYEHESRHWSQRHGGSVVELHAYAVPEDADPAAVTAAAFEQATRVWPELASARALHEHTQWRADCPLFGVGSFARRPRVDTPFPGLVLAGDAIRIDLPVALMERAAATGWAAANTLLREWGVRGHPLHSVARAGRIPLLSPLAAATTRKSR